MDSEKITQETQWQSDLVYVSRNEEKFKKIALKMSQQDYKDEIFNNPKIEITMKNQIEKSESVKKQRFSVIENGLEVLSTSKELEASGRIIQLQGELKPLIISLDHQKKKSVHFKKTIHERNYRVLQGDYEKDSVTNGTTLTTEVSETEE